MQPQPLMSRAEDNVGDTVISLGKSEASLHPQDATMQRVAFQPGHKDPPAPSPPRAIASLSVRVLGQPDRQGLPPVTPRTHEKEGAAPSEPGSAHSVLHLSRSAGGLPAGGRAKEDSDEDDSVNESDEEEEEEEDWGPGPAGPRRDNKAHLQPKAPLGVPSTFARSKRKLQPPQHIPPPQPQPQPHHSPMQLRHPTPPPSPPSGLFPLPDTPKQSPPDAGDSEDEAPEAHANRMVPFPPPSMQRQDSNSSSRSSSPEPPVKRRPGPLSLLVHKMESERASRQSETPSATDSSGETAHPDAKPGSSSKSQDVAEERPLVEEKKEEQEPEKKQQEEEKERGRKQQEEVKLQKKEDQERKYQEEKKERQGQKVQKFPREETRGKDKEASESQETDSSSDSDSKSDSSSHSSQTSSSSGNKTHPARHLKVSAHTLSFCIEVSIFVSFIHYSLIFAFNF